MAREEVSDRSRHQAGGPTTNEFLTEYLSRQAEAAATTANPTPTTVNGIPTGEHRLLDTKTRRPNTDSRP